MLIGGAVCCWLVAAIIIALVGLPDRAVYSGTVNSEGSRVAPEMGAFAPQFRAPTLLNGEFNLGAQRGVAVVLNFWATWCEPCRVEMPEIEQFHEAYPAIRVVGVNLGETAATVARWVQANHLTFEMVFDAGGEIARLYALRGQPSTYVIAPNGMITQIFFGATTMSALRTALEPFLN